MQILLQNATLLDPAWPEPRHGHLLVEDGLIRDLHATSSSPGCQVIDLHGQSVLPGLIDSHVHVMASMMDLAANAQLPAPLAILRALPILSGMLARGFTTVRDTGGAHPSLAEAIAQGLIPGPRLFTCGKALSKTGGHSDARPRYDTHDPNRWSPNPGSLGRIADGIDQVRLACRQQLREGASFIKIMGSGGVASPTDPVHWYGYTPEEIRAAVEECRDAHTYVAAHVYTADTIARAVDCGVHSLEHCNLIDAPAARRAAQAGCVAVPTLVTYEALAGDGPSLGLPAASIAKIDNVRRSGLESLSILRDAGVTMAFGTDLLGPTHRRQNEEFAIRARALPARDILLSATTIGAKLVGMEGKLGTLAPGAIADLIAVHGNPLDDITLLAHPERNLLLVMKDGAIHHRRAMENEPSA